MDIKTPAMIEAVYVGKKDLPRYDKIHLIFEVPKEMHGRVSEMLGYPDAANSKWVTIFRVITPRKTDTDNEEIEEVI